MALNVFGPRFLAALGVPLANATPWAASTAYAAGKVVTFGGASYVAPAAGVVARATFTVGDWTLLASAGAPGTAGAAGGVGPQGPVGPAGAGADVFTATITGNGTLTSFPVTHNMGTTNLVGQVQDPADSNAVVPGADVLFPTNDTAQVVLSTALANGVNLKLILSGRDLTP